MEGKEKQRERCREYYRRNRDKVLAQKKQYIEDNKQKVLERKRKYREKNKDKIAQYNKEYYEKNKDKEIERAQKYQSENITAVKKAHKGYREKNKDRRNAQKREWRKSNRDIERVHEHTRRARLKGNGGSFTKADIEKMYRLQHKKCAACLNSIKGGFHIDHVVPLARGGANDPANLQLLCRGCNQSKHAKDPIEWAKENGKLL